MEKHPRKEQKQQKHFKLFKQEHKPLDQKVEAKPKWRKTSDRTVITGGAGYLGFTLGCTLAKLGTEVIVYDRKRPIWDVPKEVLFIQADVRDFDALYAACKGADCVVHAAAYGMSGVEQLHPKEIRSINVGGTGVVLEVCKQQSIPRLIYTSSVNVVFCGQTIVDGDEASIPYYPLNKHVSEYSRTKSIAEQMVLAANGTALAGGGILYTCALRPPGIYGPEEQRHLPRIAMNIQRGFFIFRIGSPSALMNWVHVKNLVRAHLLAAEALMAEKNYIAGGQAYFINDNEKFNLFEWLTPLFVALGVRKPTICAPLCLVRLSAVIIETAYKALSPIIEFTPLLTRSEVYNMTCTYTFKIDKAKAQLGYNPKKYTLAETVNYYMRKHPPQKDYFVMKSFLVMFFLVALIFMVLRYPELLSLFHYLREQYEERNLLSFKT